MGAGRNLAATGWLVDTAAVQATVVHMDSRDSGRHLGWRRGRGHGRDGSKVLAAMAVFVALNGRLGVNQLATVSDPAFLNGMSLSPFGSLRASWRAGHQVRTMDESDALRLCGDWLEGGQRSAACVCRKANQGTRGHCDLDARRARPNFDIDSPSFRLSEAPQAGGLFSIHMLLTQLGIAQSSSARIWHLRHDLCSAHAAWAASSVSAGAGFTLHAHAQVAVLRMLLLRGWR